MRKHRARFFSEDNFSASLRGELAMPAHEIRVQMSFNHILDLEAHRLGFIGVLIDIALRIDDRGFFFGADQVRRVRQTPEIKLFEVHSLIRPFEICAGPKSIAALSDSATYLADSKVAKFASRRRPAV